MFTKIKLFFAMTFLVFGGVLLTACSPTGDNVVSKLAPIKASQLGSVETIKRLDEEKSQVYVFYKDTCAVCKKFLPTIHRELSDTEYNVYYVDVEKGLPDWVHDHIDSDLLTSAKTPYVIQVNKDYKTFTNEAKIAVHGRLDSHAKILEAIRLFDRGRYSDETKEIK